MPKSHSSPLTTQTPSGFTLVELMVVVGIVGILASIAIPNYQKYQAKSRQMEAKVNLSAIYMAESSFAATQMSYTCCLQNIGYVPAGGSTATQLGYPGTQPGYYAIGFFWNGTMPYCGSNNTTECCSIDFSVTPATSCSGNASWNASSTASSYSASATKLTNTTMSTTSFIAEAAGYISNSNTNLDEWTIDQTNTLSNIQSGL